MAQLAADRRVGLAIDLVLVAAIVAIYAQVAGHEFLLYDDVEYILENPRVTAGLTWSSVDWAFRTGHAANWHPLTWLSHMLDCQLFGLWAGGHALVSVGIHVANTLLLRRIVGEMVDSVYVAAFVAGAFALHPLAAESVAWVPERKNVLSTLFWFSAWWAYLRWVKAPRAWLYVLMCLLLAAGLAAKPMLVTFPFTLLLLDYWPLERLQPVARRVFEKLPMFALSVASSVVTFLVQRQAGAVAEIAVVPMSARIENALLAYAIYLRQMIWPAGLTAYYPFRLDLSPIAVGAAACLLVALSAVGLWYARRAPYAIVGWLWYLGTLVPVIGIVKAGEQAYADRFTYVPLLGIFLGVAVGGTRLASARPALGRSLAAAAGLVLALWGVAAHHQVSLWRDTSTMFSHTLAVTGDNPFAETNLAAALMGKGRTEEALRHYSEVIRRQSTASPVLGSAANAHLNLGVALADRGQTVEALEHYRAALAIAPNSDVAHLNLGILLARDGKLPEAIGAYQAALRLRPDYVKAHNQLGVALAASGQSADAIRHFEAVLELSPGFGPAHANLAVALGDLGRLDQAIAHYRLARAAMPRDPQVLLNLAGLLAQQGQRVEALSVLDECDRLAPDWPPAREKRAQILATDPGSATGSGAGRSGDLGGRPHGTRAHGDVD